MSAQAQDFAHIILSPEGWAWMLEKHGERKGPRQRTMKARDVELLKRTISAISANLILAIVERRSPPAFGVSLRAAKQGASRYDRKGFSNLTKVLEAFSSAEVGLWTLRKSNRRGVSSVVVAGSAFTSNIRYELRYGKHGPSITDFYREPGQEPIILTRSTHDYYADSTFKEWIDYADTPQSDAFRAEMDRINSHLRAADVRFTDDGGPTVINWQYELRRYFSLLEGDSEDTPRFDQGGRLFGGWWQKLEKERRGSIRIDGEPIADLDFSNMFLRLAYLEAGHEPPNGDLYANIPGLAEPYWRDGVKVLVNAMLFRTTPMLRLPRDPKLRLHLPPGAKGSVMRAAILAGHPLLQDVFETGVGFRLMFLESQILVSAMLKMIEAGITALPMHDGVMVPRSKHAAAAECMTAASLEVAGQRLPISLKTLYE
jgi:hypothetical protein